MQPRFIYNASGPFTKNELGIQKFKETGDLRHLYQKELNKSCFQHHMAYREFKILTRRTAFNKTLHDKAFNIAKKIKL